MKQVKNGKMFLRLRHDAFICRDDKQRRIDPADARQHVLDEISMTRNIHNAHLFTARKCKPAESKFDGHLAGFFLFEAVGVRSGERFDQRGFSMVNMTCGANNSHGVI